MSGAKKWNTSGTWSSSVTPTYVTGFAGRSSYGQPRVATCEGVPIEGVRNARVEAVSLANGLKASEAMTLGRDDTFKSARLLILDGFLPDAESEDLVKFAIEQRSAFFPATITEGSGYTVNESLRRARVVKNFGAVQERMKTRIAALATAVASHLQLDARLGDVVESEMTAYNDGDFFAIHADAANERVARLISYVYYLCRQPKPFSGGQLRMFDSRALEDGTRDIGQAFEVEPLNNRLVLFASEHLHEVLPIRCASRQFIDSRFTINGWLHRN